MYPHIVIQFETDYVVQSELAINEDLYNSKYKDRLELSYKAACGLNQRSVDIDAADLDNKLTAMEYIDDIYKFYT
ncbi:hypothetical protein RJT34_16125 [Clitoria ternatea]|uniref:FACT complex subunit SSRP1-like first PH domain-containing protein n=1 Tax=Clitoria ternatea TaxID=43366 RepID=A0AAN9J6M3_CLITE